MMPAEIAREYAAIVAGLDEAQVAALWTAVLAGRRLEDSRLAVPADRLNALRDSVGRASAARARQRQTLEVAS
jgi:hypothetical protein